MRRASLLTALLALAFVAQPALAHEAGHGGGVAQRLSQPLQPGLTKAFCWSSRWHREKPARHIATRRMYSFTCWKAKC